MGRDDGTERGRKLWEEIFKLTQSTRHNEYLGKYEKCLINLREKFKKFDHTLVPLGSHNALHQIFSVS